MRALLLAAGLGTRLDPLTRYVPKCLMPIRGRPLLDHWFEKLSRLGVGDFVVNTHHHADMVAEFVRRSRFAEQVELAHEPTLLGTSGTIREHAAFLKADDSLVLHADNLCDDDLTGLIAAHRSRLDECVMTMLTYRTTAPSSCGIVETDVRGVMTALHHKVAHPPSNVANAATYVFTPELIDEVVAAPDAWDFSGEMLPRLVGRALTHHTDVPFTDIGTIPAFLQAATDSDAWFGADFLARTLE
jgi:mannose-1-phosphate guanylyltransferase